MLTCDRCERTVETVGPWKDPGPFRRLCTRCKIELTLTPERKARLEQTIRRALAPFADPGGRSALRASSRRNPRNRPCPTCNAPDVLTPADVAAGYQCDRCADRDESGGYGCGGY